VRDRNPELAARFERYQAELDLSSEAADVLTGDLSVANFFEETVGTHGDAKVVAKWVVNEVSPHFTDGRVEALNFGGAELGALLALIDAGTISGKSGKDVLTIMVAHGGDPAAIVEDRGLQQVTDEGAIEAAVDRVIAAHPGKAEDYRGGRTGLAGFFVGQVMRETGGAASPELVNKLVRTKLDS
jgi:glutaminyl-tRNA synthetase